MLKHHKLALFCLFANVICYVDRTNISVAIIPMSQAMHWDLITQGTILASFYVGYISTQILGGLLSGFYGGGPILLNAVIIWSFFTLITPPFTYSVPMVVLVRIGMGMGEGVALPAIHNLIARWSPVGERSRLVALVGSGHALGMVISLCASPLVAWHWPLVFYIFGTLGLLWALIFFLWSPTNNNPPTDDWAFETVSGSCGSPASPIPLPGPSISPSNIADVPCWRTWLMLASSKHSIAIFVAHFCTAWGWYIMLSWLPKYFVSLKVDTAGAGFYAIIPYALQSVIEILAGVWADRLIASGHSRTKIRKLMQTVASLGPAFFLFLLVKLNIRSPVVASCFVTLALVTKGFSVAGVSVNMVDIAPRYAGQLFGLSNTFATLAGILGNYVTGVLWQATGSLDLALYSCVVMYLIATWAYVSFATGEVVFKQ